jgi:CheY-like chemotaxis protein
MSRAHGRRTNGRRRTRFRFVPPTPPQARGSHRPGGLTWLPGASPPEGDRRPAAGESAPHARPRGAPPLNAPACALVADPDRDHRETLALYLELCGHRTRVAATAAEALRLARAEPPAVAILDCRFPDLDGFALARRLREACGGDTLLVLLSGREYPPREVAGAGFDRHLVKPCEPADLLDLVEGIQERQETRRVVS